MEILDQVFAVRNGRFDIAKTLDKRRGRKTECTQFLEKLHVGLGLKFFHIAHAVTKHMQPSFGAFSRIEQADAPGSDVAGVGEGRFAALLLGLVEKNQI